MAKCSYRHVIITRFSVRFNMLTEKNGTLFNSKRLNKRMHVFKTVYLPSLLNQKWKHFYCVLLIDQQLPETYKIQLRELVDKYSFIRILEWKADIYKLSQIDWLKDANIDINVNHIITTRLDDDDALHPDFTNIVQMYYKKQGYNIKHLRFLTFPHGIIWMQHKGLMNPFNMNFIALGMTLIVNARKYPVNVYGFNHAKLKHSYKQRYRNVSYIYNWLSKKLGRLVTPKHFTLNSAMLSIITKFPMYIYAMHGYNDSAAKYYNKLFINGGIYTQNDVIRVLRLFSISV